MKRWLPVGINVSTESDRSDSLIGLNFEKWRMHTPVGYELHKENIYEPSINVMWRKYSLCIEFRYIKESERWAWLNSDEDPELFNYVLKKVFGSKKGIEESIDPGIEYEYEEEEEESNDPLERQY